MVTQIDVGDGSSAAPDLIPISVSAGQTVTVTNMTASGASVSYLSSGIDGAQTSLTPGNNVALTVPAWLQSSGGVATVQITGGLYG